jgi:hypothetical protein
MTLVGGHQTAILAQLRQWVQQSMKWMCCQYRHQEAVVSPGQSATKYGTLECHTRQWCGSPCVIANNSVRLGFTCMVHDVVSTSLQHFKK